MRKLRYKTSTDQGNDVMTTLSLKNVKSSSVSGSRINKITTKQVSNGLLAYPVTFSYDILKHTEKSDQSYAAYNFQVIKNLTTDFGFKQNDETHASINIYSLDDNAMALVIMCEHYELTREKTDIELIDIYLNFIQYCLQPTGYFFKYVDAQKKFTHENETVNLADSTGCAMWALGYLISKKQLFPLAMVEKAEILFQEAMQGIKKIYSTKAIAYIIKGLYYYNTKNETIEGVWLIKQLANQIVKIYKEVESSEWKWFENTIAIESSLISEALLCAWKATGDPVYREISKTSFDFLLAKIFNNESNVQTNEEFQFQGKKSTEINTLIFSLKTFYTVFKEEDYALKIKRAAQWLQWNKFMQF